MSQVLSQGNDWDCTSALMHIFALRVSGPLTRSAVIPLRTLCRCMSGLVTVALMHDCRYFEPLGAFLELPNLDLSPSFEVWQKDNRTQGRKNGNGGKVLGAEVAVPKTKS